MKAAMYACAFTLAAASAAGAQLPRKPQPDSLPRELVEALMRSSVSVYPGSAEFVVGTVPEQLRPFLYVPKDARILGGMTTSGNVVAALMTRLTPTQATAEYQRELPKLGWTSASNIGRAWGFVPAAGANMTGSGLEFCHIGQSLQILPTNAPGGTQLVAVVQNFGGRCSGNSMFVVTEPNRPQAPTLFNPMGATMNPAACSGQTAFPGGYATTERLQTSLTPAQLIESFAKQLADSGWKSADSPAASRVWLKPDTGGVTRRVVVSAAPGLNGCLDVTMDFRTSRVP